MSAWNTFGTAVIGFFDAHIKRRKTQWLILSVKRFRRRVEPHHSQLGYRRRRFLTGLARALVVASPLLVYGHVFEANELEVVRTEVGLERWPVDEPVLSVGFLSDLHCDSEDAVARVGRAAAMLMAQRPDIVLLGGDYITWDAVDWIAPMASALAPVSAAPRGAFGVFGNHDCWSMRTADIRAALLSHGIRVLLNESVPIAQSGKIWLTGLGDRTVRAQKPREAVRAIPPRATRLLLMHEPDYADQCPVPFDLQLSGHSHAGQVRIFGHPIYCPPLGRQYPQGLQKGLSHLVYTTRGVGMMSPKLRIDCPPEVSILKVGPAGWNSHAPSRR